jgi:trehalose 6-phosphate synthase/phosphatase
LHKRVCTHTVDRWASKFLSTLEGVQSTPRTRPLTGAERQRLLTAASGAKQRVLLVDYDGTLAPLVPLRHRAAPSPAVLSLLQRLQQDPRNVLAVVSSRDRFTLERWLGACGCILAAEHGAWFNTDGTWEFSHELNDDWKGTIRPLLERVVEQTPGSILEEKDYSLVWHYRMTDPEFGLWQARELCSQLQGMLAGSELQVQSGNKVVEVKWSKIHKGVAASQIIERAQSADFILALGDDHTDEDMFAAIPADQWTVKVGMGISSARFSLPNSADVQQLLQDLAET